MASLKYLPGGGNGEPGRNLLSLLAFFFFKCFSSPGGRDLHLKAPPPPGFPLQKAALGTCFRGWGGGGGRNNRKSQFCYTSTSNSLAPFPKGVILPKAGSWSGIWIRPARPAEEVLFA